jgi:RHS repeat-associated protein
MEYSANGDRTKDTAKVQNADDHSAYLDNVFAYTFDPLDRIAKVEKKDATGSTVQSTESYTHDPAGNVVAQTVKGVSTTYSYDRNRLLTATTGGATASYTYDPFGRLSQASAGGKVIERNTYDGYDRIIKHRQLQDDGTTKTTDTTFDALDRTSSKVEGTKTTNYSYLGLSGEVLSEEVAGQLTASYQYSPWGSRLSQVKFKADGTSEDSYYGYNPHSDVETLTTDTGDTRSTYGYTAYGKNDDDRFTGVDKPEAQNPGKDPYNVYRFNAKRWDQSSESYDMGFRDYSPGLNRFLTRDSYSGALADMNLGTDPWTSNRYAFAGGNPISGVEIDGHYAIDDEGNRVDPVPPSRAVAPTVANQQLQNILNATYSDPKAKEVLGDGKAATALRNEMATGEPTKIYHHQDVLDLAARYRKLLRENFNATNRGNKAILTLDEETIARNEFRELWDALQQDDKTGAVNRDLETRGLAPTAENTIRSIAQDPVVSKETGAVFEQADPFSKPRLTSYGGGRFFGRALGVVGVVGDLQFAWEAGRVMSGKPPSQGFLPESLLCAVVGCSPVS